MSRAATLVRFPSPSHIEMLGAYFDVENGRIWGTVKNDWEVTHYVPPTTRVHWERLFNYAFMPLPRNVIEPMIPADVASDLEALVWNLKKTCHEPLAHFIVVRLLEQFARSLKARKRDLPFPARYIRAIEAFAAETARCFKATSTIGEAYRFAALLVPSELFVRETCNLHFSVYKTPCYLMGALLAVEGLNSPLEF